MLTNNNLNIVRIGYKNWNISETSCKKEDKYKAILISFDSVPARWSRMVESMVFTLFGLLTRRSSREGCCGKLRFLYPSNKILLQFSWTHFPVNHNKWPSKRLTLTRDAIQNETNRIFSTSPNRSQVNATPHSPPGYNQSWICESWIGPSTRCLFTSALFHAYGPLDWCNKSLI